MLRFDRRMFLKAAALAAGGWIGTQFALAGDAVKDIDDADLFAAMDLEREGLQQVREAVARKDYPRAYRAWGEYWQTVAPVRGLFIGDGEMLRSRAGATASLGPSREKILDGAEQILAHKIKGWGDVVIQHGPVVDFGADYGKNGLYGFHYWGWSRHLIQAYLLTSDAKYLDCFEQLFNQWYEQRNQIHGEIPNLDPIYYELGLGLRCRPFMEFYCLGKPGAQTHERMLKTMLGAARWLYESEQQKYRGGNWQIMGSFGLTWIGVMLPEFKDAGKWVTVGSGRIAEHMEADFFPDGCHSERVPSSYMLVAYRDPRNLAVLLEGKKEFAQIRERIRPGLKRTLEWYFAMMPPDGFIPAINDGARSVFPEALVEDARKMFQMHPAPKELSVSFPKSGFTAMRSSWESDALYMLINHGPSGGGHSHADSLSFEMHAYGQACAIDSGIGYTYDDPNHRPWYVRTRAHNVLMVDGDDLVRPEAEGRDVVWTTLPGLDLFAATHLGYLKSKGITHRRHITFVKPHYWIIYDTIDAKAGTSRSGSRALSWNLHCPTMMESHQNGFASESGPGLIVLPSSIWTPNREKAIANVRGIRGFEKMDYHGIDWIWFEHALAVGGATSLGVLLYPFADKQPAIKFNRIKDNHFAIEHPDGVDHVLIGAVDSNEFNFNGACAVIRGRRYSAAKSLTLKIDGKPVIDSKDPIDREDNF